jgi:predicted DNA binding CopG/RHH family protein
MTTRKRAKPKLKPIPTFRSEDEEREFWAKHDTVDYIDWSQARWVTFPNLKPSTETISLRLPAALLADLKILANKRDVPYQSLLKVFLAERLRHERAAETVALSNPRLRPTRARRTVLRKRSPATRPRS